LAYLKVEDSAWKWPIGIAGMLSWSFLISGFSWLLLYPILLLLVGWMLSNRRNGAGATDNAV